MSPLEGVRDITVNYCIHHIMEPQFILFYSDYFRRIRVIVLLHSNYLIKNFDGLLLNIPIINSSICLLSIGKMQRIFLYTLRLLNN
jgi:hypothetical protein